MTPEENRALDALERVSMRLASAGKRFRRNMSWEREHAPGFKLTARQARYLWLLVYLYRRQIKDQQLVGYGVHVKITDELPEIYLEGDHAPVVQARRVYRKVCIDHGKPLDDGKCPHCRDAAGEQFVLDMQSYYLEPIEGKDAAPHS